MIFTFKITNFENKVFSWEYPFSSMEKAKSYFFNLYRDCSEMKTVFINEEKIIQN